ncbi:RND transporter [Desulfuromonas versatilis]|uniref:RND transporter n=1 Tax=Desulfuromonas versatilis TaxID=2802975 RepID=A0ABM8HSY3_9BACT|nr:TolC family protein [Desulfuromonas versatilis]BCR05083.1 RND transporter [Desulfuromonas versatilis]
MMRFSTLFLLLVLIAAVPCAANEGEAQDKRPILERLVAQALVENPDLRAAEQRWRMFERKVIPAGTLDDPMLTLSMNNFPVDTLAGNEAPMTSRDIVLAQKFPFPGKLGSKAEQAEQQALWYKGVYEDSRLQLVRQVKDAYYSLYYLDKAIEITEKNLKLLDDFIRLTEIRYQVGQGLQQDVLKAQVERSKLMDRLFALRQQRLTAQANLNTLLARPAASPVEKLPEFELVEAKVSVPELIEQAEEARPLFAAYQSLIDRFRSQKKFAELDYRPDFNVFAAYKFREENRGDDGVDFVSAGVTFNLPVWQERRGEVVAEADSGIRMAYQQYNDLRNKVGFNISDAHAQLEKNRQQVLLFKTGIIPQATQALQAALSAYQVGKVEFLSLLDAQLTLQRYEMDYYRALTDYQRSLARLEAEAGRSLTDSQAKETSP